MNDRRQFISQVVVGVVAGALLLGALRGWNTESAQSCLAVVIINALALISSKHRYSNLGKVLAITLVQVTLTLALKNSHSSTLILLLGTCAVFGNKRLMVFGVGLAAFELIRANGLLYALVSEIRWRNSHALTTKNSVELFEGLLLCGSISVSHLVYVGNTIQSSTKIAVTQLSMAIILSLGV
jgi:hypothetical protein